MSDREHFESLPATEVRAWPLAADVCYLNHGSFGPSPRAVLAARHDWLARLESDPVDFLQRQLDGHLAAARERLAGFVGCPADDLVFVENATYAMNVVAASVALAPGDEVLISDHEYGAVVRLWERRCRQAKAKLVTAELGPTLHRAEAVVDAFFALATGRTRLAVFSHVTSPTAVVLPAAELCARARALGISVAIDGPHALAMLPLAIAGLGCDYYAASCHKWLSAPIGSGFLYAHPRVRPHMQPPIVSWGKPTGPAPSWRDEFDWSGTRDPSAFLSVPAAIEFLERAGIERFREHGHRLARLACRRICELAGSEPLVPEGSAGYGTMISVPLPIAPERGPELQRALWDDARVEIPLTAWHGRLLIRPSCHLYTTEDHIDRLANALGRLIRGGRFD